MYACSISNFGVCMYVYMYVYVWKYLYMYVYMVLVEYNLISNILTSFVFCILDSPPEIAGGQATGGVRRPPAATHGQRRRELRVT